MCFQLENFNLFFFTFSFYLFAVFTFSFKYTQSICRGFLASSNGKQSACNAGELGLIPGLQRSPEEGCGNPLQHYCLENSMDRRAWQATVHGVTKRWTQMND